ncbi:MAG TPA: hypothetical protein VHP56_03595 [Solirubrobacterales bacterium]|jgi:hypothetical protein|nr:hypothetical protein [Solirubrobacterales bacterium]
MTATDITFYATIATVIPAFLVAYVVGVQKIMVGFAEGHANSTQEYLQVMRGSWENEGGRLHNFLSGMLAMTRATFFQIASACLFVVAVGTPAVAEYVSLHSLYAGHATADTKTVGLVGALVAGTVVVAPLALSMLRAYDPFGLPIGLARLFIEQIKTQNEDTEQSQLPKSGSEDAAGDTRDDAAHCGDG